MTTAEQQHLFKQAMLVHLLVNEVMSHIMWTVKIDSWTAHPHTPCHLLSDIGAHAELWVSRCYKTAVRSLRQEL